MIVRYIALLGFTLIIAGLSVVIYKLPFQTNKYLFCFTVPKLKLSPSRKFSAYWGLVNQKGNLEMCLKQRAN